MLMLHFFTALSPHQKFVIEKLSRLNLKESKEIEYNSLNDDPEESSPQLEDPK